MGAPGAWRSVAAGRVASPPVSDVPAHRPQSEQPLDLAAIERDLDGVERALERLDDGSYWVDEITGEPLPDDLLAADPVARRRHQ